MISNNRLRCIVGVLGGILPIIVSVLLWTIPPSISSTYYTYEAGPVFMLIMGMAAILLFAYKGYELIDDIVTSLTSLFAVGICLFPCSGSLPIVGTFQIPVDTSNTIHLVCAFGFFGLLAFNSLFLFTKTSGEMTANKKKRNIIYIICGIGMIASFLILLLPWFYIQIWLVETFALAFFAVSWLTKADCIPFLFCDPKSNKANKAKTK